MRSTSLATRRFGAEFCLFLEQLIDMTTNPKTVTQPHFDDKRLARTIAITDTRTAARLLGGDLFGRNSILCPGPGHSRADRSLHVTFDMNAPEGFIVRSYASDDF